MSKVKGQWSDLKLRRSRRTAARYVSTGPAYFLVFDLAFYTCYFTFCVTLETLRLKVVSTSSILYNPPDAVTCVEMRKRGPDVHVAGIIVHVMSGIFLSYDVYWPTGILCDFFF